MNISAPALRPYLEMIEKQCRELDREDLIQLILTMAQQVAPGKRTDFLVNFQSHLSTAEQEISNDPTNPTQLQAELEELHESVRTRIISIEDGSYWDDPDEEDWDSYHLDTDPEPLNDEQIAAFSDFFSEADHHFFHGAKAMAKMIYSALFAIITEIEDYDSSSDLEINLREERARLARCEYELSSDEDRLEVMLSIMGANPSETSEFSLQKLPLLQDVRDAAAADLADFDSFLAAWRQALAKQPCTQNRVADLLLEAAFLQNGSEAVGELARAWQNNQPRGYLFLLRQLEREENWPALRDAGFETLSVFTADRNRFKTTDFLIAAGRNLGDDATTLAGFRERFQADIRDSTLLDLLTEADRQQRRTEELETACAFCAKIAPKVGEKLLLVKTLLMAGLFDQAFAHCQKDKIVGWSYSATGLLFAGVLSLLCDGDSSCLLIHQLLEDYGGGDTIFFDSYNPRSIGENSSGAKEIRQGLRLVDKTTIDLDSYRKWAGTIGEQRVNHIVSNTHRSAYNRAAKVLGALAETMVMAGDQKKAQALLQEYCKVLYNRHSAFRREVRQAVSSSKILAGMGGGL